MSLSSKVAPADAAFRRWCARAPSAREQQAPNNDLQKVALAGVRGRGDVGRLVDPDLPVRRFRDEDGVVDLEGFGFVEADGGEQELLRSGLVERHHVELLHGVVSGRDGVRRRTNRVVVDRPAPELVEEMPPAGERPSREQRASSWLPPRSRPDPLLARGIHVTRRSTRFEPVLAARTSKSVKAGPWWRARGCGRRRARRGGSPHRRPVAELFSGVDTVFHLAGQPGVRLSWADGFSEYDSHNILATQRVLEGIRTAGVSRMVFASSSSVYGNAERYPTLESDLPRPRSPYGVTKLAPSTSGRTYADALGARRGAVALLHRLRSTAASAGWRSAPVRRHGGAAALPGGRPMPR